MFANRYQTETTYDKALEKHIISLIEGAVDGRLLETELYDNLGRHKEMVNKVIQLEYRNVIRRIPIRSGKTKDNVLYVPSPIPTKWSTMKAMPCFTCEKIDSCKIGNTNNPVDCSHFNNWIMDKDQE